MENTPIAPEFPVIEIGGRKLVVKFDSLGRFRMSALGVGMVEMRMFRRVQSVEEMDPGILALVLKLFACAVANNFVDVLDPAAPARIPTPEYWAQVIKDDQWKDVCTCVMTALVKAFPPLTAPPAAEAVGAKTQPN